MPSAVTNARFQVSRKIDWLRTTPDLYLYLFFSGILTRLLKRRRLTVLIPPIYPKRGYVLWKMCQVEHIRLVTSPDVPHDRKLLFSDATVVAVPPSFAASDPADVINIRCADIRKSRVASVFAEVFGYELAVDPRRHVGPMVVKSETNGTHSGRIVTGPIESPEDNAVYQRLIDNRDVGDDAIVDLRLVIVADKIVNAYRKLRPVATRFANANRSVTRIRVEDFLSPDERQAVLRFTKAFGLDFGELDVLRDRQDGRIYVSDVNTTSGGPPTLLPPSVAILAMKEVAEAFCQAFEPRR